MSQLAMFAQILGTGLKVQGALNASRAVQQQAAFDNYQTQLQRNQNRLQAQEKSIQRRSQFDAAQASNTAAFAFMNRDVGLDRSLKAFQRKQKEILAQDIKAIEANAFVNDVQLQGQQAIRSYEASIQSRDYQREAMISVATGLYNYNVSKS